MRMEVRAYEIGASSVVVTLPSVWRKANHVKKDDVLIAELEDGKITFSVPKDKKKLAGD